LLRSQLAAPNYSYFYGKLIKQGALVLPVRQTIHVVLQVTFSDSQRSTIIF